MVSNTLSLHKLRLNPRQGARNLKYPYNMSTCWSQMLARVMRAAVDDDGVDGRNERARA